MQKKTQPGAEKLTQTSVGSLINQYDELSLKAKPPIPKAKTVQNTNTTKSATNAATLTTTTSSFFSTLFAPSTPSSSPSSTSTSSSSPSSTSTILSSFFSSFTSQDDNKTQTRFLFKSNNTASTPTTNNTINNNLPVNKPSPSSSHPITRSASATISFFNSNNNNHDSDSTSTISSSANHPTDINRMASLPVTNNKLLKKSPSTIVFPNYKNNNNASPPEQHLRSSNPQNPISPRNDDKPLEMSTYTLNLSNQNLFEFPRQYYKDNSLSHLKELNLSGNKLSTLSPDILKFTFLVTLDLSFNQFHTIPIFVGKFKELQHLKLAGNPLDPFHRDLSVQGEQAVINHFRRQIALEKQKAPGIRTTQSPVPTPTAPTEQCESPLEKFRYAARKYMSQSRMVNADDTAKNTHYIEVGEQSFYFREYSTKSFQWLRDRNKIDPKLFYSDLCVSELSELGFSGKSGSLLFQSKSGTFILKTISKQESQFLRSFLPAYITHLEQTPKSLLVQFLGHFRVFGGLIEDDLYFLIMKNGLSTKSKIDERYDLKGSTVGRKTIFSCIINQPVRFSTMILKDLDLDDMNKKIELGKSTKQWILSTLYKDSQFLARNQIIDYSLLLGVHFLDPKLIPKLPSFELNKIDDFHSSDGGYYSLDAQNKHLGRLYFMAIIDILQPYNIKKQIERATKGLYYEKDELSVAPPDMYADRFFTFIAQHME